VRLVSFRQTTIETEEDHPLNTLHTLRIVLSHLSERATSAQTALVNLSKQRVWLNREKTIHKVANGVFYGGYDINDGVSFDEFVDEMTEELDALHARETYAGVDCYVFLPFAKGGSPKYSNELGLGYLSMLGEHADVVREHAPVVLGGGPVAGLSDDEERWLCQALEDRSVALINALRDIETALHYVLTARSGNVKSVSAENKVGEDELIDAWLLQFALYIAIAGFPAATHFGSDSDRLNHIKTIPADMMQVLTVPKGFFTFSEDTPCQL
jgi:hypothetical protein